MDLTESQQEALLNFQAITDCYDLMESLSYLQSNAWDPTVQSSQAAANAYINGRASPSPLQEEEPWTDSYDVPDPVATIFSNISSRVQSVWNRFGTAYSVPGAIRGDPEHQQPRIVSIVKKRFPDLLRVPKFQVGALDGCEQVSKTSRRPMLIWFYVAQTSKDYLRDVFFSEVVVDILDRNFLIWGLDEKAVQFEPLKRSLGLQVLPALVAGRCAAQRQIEHIESLVYVTSGWRNDLRRPNSFPRTSP